MENLQQQHIDITVRLKQLQSDFFQAQRDLEAQVGRQRGTISRLARGGIRPADEVISEVMGDLHQKAERGRLQIQRFAKDKARPNHDVDELNILKSITRTSMSDLLGVTKDASGRIRDNSDILAALFEDQLEKIVTRAIEQECSEPTVPPAEDRPAAIEAAVAELKRLEQERDALQDRSAELLGMKPSAKTMAAAEEARRQQHLDSLNEISSRHDAA